MLRFPKPQRSPKKPWRTIKHTARIRSAHSSRLGSHRERVKYADDLWRRFIRTKEPSGVCPVCRRRRWMDAMHCFPKGRYPSLRHDPDNGAPGCRPCHRILDCDHLAKEQFFRRYMGDVKYGLLMFRAMGRSKADVGLSILLLERLLDST